jgi:hypothetical protein
MDSLRKSEERTERPASMGSLERHASTANGERMRLYVREIIQITLELTPQTWALAADPLSRHDADGELHL